MHRLRQLEDGLSSGTHRNASSSQSLTASRMCGVLELLHGRGSPMDPNLTRSENMNFLKFMTEHTYVTIFRKTNRLVRNKDFTF